MSALNSWYPGDPIAHFGFIVSATVALVSMLGLMVSWFLKYSPAHRYWVLHSALIGIVASPALVAVFHASGVSLVS